MKKLVLLLLLISCYFVAPAQQVQREIFTVVEEMPQFPGGNPALFRYLKKNIKYPRKAKKEKTEGQAVVKFIVEPDGTVSSPSILSKVGDGCEEELLRVVRKMPRWNPGRQNGAFVAVYYTLPVSFSF